MQLLAVLLAAVVLLRTRAQSSSGPQLFTYTTVKEYPHDPAAFTQGLDFDRSGELEFFWESTGVAGLMTPIPLPVPLTGPAHQLRHAIVAGLS